MSKDVVIRYEKVSIKGTDKYLLKPNAVDVGKLEKNANLFINEDEEIFYSFNDAEKLREGEAFYGHPTTLDKLTKLSQSKNSVADEFLLVDNYYDKYKDDFLVVSIKDNNVTVKQADIMALLNVFDKDETKFIKENENIAIMYEKILTPGTNAPTFLLKPIGVIYGNYIKDKKLFIADGEEYNAIYNPDALMEDGTTYVGDISNVKDIIDTYKDEDVEKLSKKYFDFYASSISFAVCEKEFKLCKTNVNEITFQTASEQPSNKDEILINEINEMVGLCDTEIDDENKVRLYDFYRDINKFLYDDGRIKGIGIDDVTSDTVRKVFILLSNLRNVIEGLDIKAEVRSLNKKALKDKEEKEEKVSVNKVEHKYPEYSFDDLYKGITDVVIGQDEHVEQIVSVLYKRLVELKLDSKLPSQFGMLVTGSTGVGKSEIFKTFASIPDLPIQFMDATPITAAGYVGRDVSEYIQELYDACHGDLEKVRHAFMILDEVDKVRSSQTSGSEKDVNGKAVQDLFLKFMDGTNYDIATNGFSTATINTSLMTPISIGRFPGLFNKKEFNLGFNDELEKKIVVGTKQFVDYGMTDEFMGRHYINVHLNDLNTNLCLRILKESSKSPIKMQKAIYNEFGVDAIFTDEYQKAVAEKAIKMETGARALAGVVANTTWMPIKKIDQNRGEYNKVIFTKETVEDPKIYELRRD